MMYFAASALVTGWELTCTHHQWLRTSPTELPRWSKIFSRELSCSNQILVWTLCGITALSEVVLVHRYVRGEACVTMGFSLHASKLNGGESLNAILGSAINQDGRSSSLTAPNGPSQQQASIW